MGAPLCGASAGFRRRYRLAGSSVLDEIEQEVIGVVYGANGYTTAVQADDLVRRLALGAGMTLLDVGGGRGWPSRYMAEVSGCDVVVTDPVREGLAVDKGRAAQCLGETLPFRSAVFDAVVHSDVLC
jgi:2-polyprenyl-3-methyl-5-hydroxy-6-metoxy-1,4-benzoquinol methylase